MLAINQMNWFKFLLQFVTKNKKHLAFLNIYCYESTSFYTSFVLLTSHNMVNIRKLWFFGSTFPKRCFFWSETRQMKKHYHLLQHIWIIVQTPSFTLSNSFSFFQWICPNKYFQFKTEILNNMIEFSIFQLV